MFAQLGDIRFESLVSYSGFSKDSQTKLAKHEVLSGRPILQKLGEQSGQIALTIKLHSRFCVPEDEITRLQRARKDASVLPFVRGNGEVIGRYVVEKISERESQTDGSGNIIFTTLEVSLVESEDTSPIESQEAEAVARGVAMGNNEPLLVSSVAAPESDLIVVNTEVRDIKAAASSIDSDVRKGETAVTPSTFQQIVDKTNQISTKANNARGRIAAASNDFQTKYDRLSRDLQNLESSSANLKAAAEGGDFSAVSDANSLFQSSVNTVNSSAAISAAAQAARRSV